MRGREGERASKRDLESQGERERERARDLESQGEREGKGPVHCPLGRAGPSVFLPDTGPALCPWGLHEFTQGPGGGGGEKRERERERIII